MAPGFRAHLSDTESRCVVVLGELDAFSRDQLEAELRVLGTDKDTVLDLSQLTFIDSGGLHLLIVYHGLHDDAGSRLKIRNPSQPFQRLARLTGLAAFFDIEDDE